MRVNKFVLDTNVWLSYFISNRTEFLIDLVANRNVVIYRCTELLKELARILDYEHIKKYGLNKTATIRLVKQITINHNLEYPVKNYIPGDKDDDYIVALALQTNSGFITSGDRHILSQKKSLELQFRKLKIITKAEFESKFI